MTDKELKRKSALLARILAYDHFLKYSKKLVSDMLEKFNNRRR